MLAKHKVNKQKKSDMRYEIDGRPRYSEKFIAWFVDNVKQPNWLDSAIEYRRKQNRK